VKVLLGSLLIAGTAIAQTAAPVTQQATPAPAPFDAIAAKKVVTDLAASLEANFVFPEVGAAYAKALRAKLAAGGYSTFPDAKAFADTVTADLQHVHRDGHLRLLPPLTGPQQQRQPASPPDLSTAIQKAGWIAPGIAYISFSFFPSDPGTLARLRAFLAEHASAKTLIIDARVHGGGGPAELDVLFPSLYAEPALLVHMDTRKAIEDAGRGVLVEGPFVKRIFGPEGIVRREHVVIPATDTATLRDAKVFVLTSGRTGSAAEHLAFALKRTGRATLVGEATFGAGHFGQPSTFEGGYRAFIPVGRTFDPITNEGWEGVGVKPDVEVPAEQALTEALRRTGLPSDEAERLAKEYRPRGAMDHPTRGKK
jgi:hypothetical protein